MASDCRLNAVSRLPHRGGSSASPVGDITADEIGRSAISALDEIPADLQGSAAYRAGKVDRADAAPGTCDRRGKQCMSGPL